MPLGMPAGSRRYVWLLAFAVLTCVAPARERIRLDRDWAFFHGDAEGAHALEFNARDWRRVDLPHDWSIELPTDPAAPSGGNGGFFQTGVGWYRHAFTAPAAWRGQRVTVEFEGVYERAEVWLNGVRLGYHPYGYTPFHFELTPLLRCGIL